MQRQCPLYAPIVKTPSNGRSTLKLDIQTYDNGCSLLITAVTSVILDKSALVAIFLNLAVAGTLVTERLFTRISVDCNFYYNILSG